LNRSGFVRDTRWHAGVGYYSWQFQRMHGDLDREQLHIGRFENLQSEFLSIMKSLEVDEVDEVDAIQAKFDKTRA
jgi:hypothetical protein